MESVTANATIIEIKNASYAVEPIDPGFAGVAAVRLTKLLNGETYAVVLQSDGLVVCECPSYVCTFEGTSGTCKHGKAVIAAGLLIAPISGGSPALATPDVPPITREDIKRAEAFGIKLPVGAKVEEAPCPGPIEAPALDLTAFASRSTIVGDVRTVEPGASLKLSEPDRLWMAETTTLLITIGAIEALEAGEDGLAIFEGLEPENLEPFHAFMRMIGSPATTFGSWLALCLAGSPVPFPEPAVVEARPTHRERFVPTPDDEALVALMFADPRHSCLSGESGPPIGDRSYPARRPRPTFNTMTDRQVYRRRGCYS